jgi:serine/threonine protein phosphatase PrpC
MGGAICACSPQGSPTSAGVVRTTRTPFFATTGSAFTSCATASESPAAESVELVQSWVRRWRSSLERYEREPSAETRGVVRRLVESAVQSACYMVFGMGLVDPTQKGMSSTLSALLVAGRTAFVGQVGDSRVYVCRGRRTTQITEDHTLVNFRLKMGLITPEEAENAPGKNVITRAVGHQDFVEVDTFELDVEPGDRFLLCSDGLHGYVENDELQGLLEGEREQVVKRLVDVANDRGGRDNITAIVCDVLPTS